jgi:hypothetical protein
VVGVDEAADSENKNLKKYWNPGIAYLDRDV